MVSFQLAGVKPDECSLGVGPGLLTAAQADVDGAIKRPAPLWK